MNIEELRAFCLSFGHVTEDFPFDDDTLVFKVCGKMFCLLSINEMCINIKCDPETILEMRESFSAVIPGIHMNKKHWNTVIIDGTISDGLLRAWISDSYQLVVQNLPLKLRKELGIN